MNEISQKKWEEALNNLQKWRENQQSKQVNDLNKIIEIIKPYIYPDIDKVFEFNHLRGNILDIGCGSGHRNLILKRCGYVGIDPLIEDDYKNNLYCGTGEDIKEALIKSPYKDFNNIFLFSVLQHCQNIDLLIKNCYNILSESKDCPDKFIFITVCLGARDEKFTYDLSENDIEKVLDDNKFIRIFQFNYNEVLYLKARI